MKLKSKKIIAREFILLILLLALGVISFLCIYPYNYYRNSQSHDLEKTIAQKNKITERLSYQYKTKFAKRDWYFEKFTVKFGSDSYKNDELWNRLLFLAKNDSIRHKWNIWDNEFSNFNIELGFDTPQKLKEFIDRVRLNKIDSTNYTEALKIKQDILKLREREKEVEMKKFSSEEQFIFGMTSTIILLIMLFPARYLFYGVRWSIKVLKEKNETTS